ncbi:MAG: methylated-DNA--[protein]-cysteine S-methyltransferase [Bacillota bacterium]
MTDLTKLTYKFSLIGKTQLVFAGEKLVELSFHSSQEHKQESYLTLPAWRACRELEDYLAGNLYRFSIPVHLKGTAFQREVLTSLREVPYGETISYKELAEAAGYPGAWQAVGQVMKTNPLPLIYPCHRVVKSDGSLGGFNGGLEMKELLLALEYKNPQPGRKG